jgi:hypothetical protein
MPVQRVALGITIDLAPLASSDRRYVDDEGAALRRAVCQAAGLPESQAQVALDQLGRDDPGRLRDLMREHCQVREGGRGRPVGQAACIYSAVWLMTLTAVAVIVRVLPGRVAEGAAMQVPSKRVNTAL